MKNILFFSVAIILAGIVIGFFIYAGISDEQEKGSLDTYQKDKCFSFSTYEPALGAWRWRAEHLNEYFPTRDDAVANCMATFDYVYSD